MKKLLLSLAIMVSFVMISKAQVTYGAKAGLNISTVSGDNTDSAKMKLGYQIGGVMNYSASDDLSIQISLLLSNKGAKDNYSTSEVKMSLNYLEIPLNVIYKINHVQLFAGPYVGVGLFGKFKVGEESKDITFTQDSKDEDAAAISLLDFGLNFGLGYMVNDNIQVQATYGLGLSNTIPKINGNSPTIKIHNSVFQLTLSYFL